MIHTRRTIATFAFAVALHTCGATAAWAGAYVAPVIQDTWLDQGDPATIHGSDVELRVHSVAGDSMRSLYYFDITGIPSLSTISSAKATFYVNGADITGNPIRVYRVTQPWGESISSWSTSATHYDASTLYGSFAPTAKGAVTVDLTALVKEWLLGAKPNLGIMLVATSASVESRYTSREWGTPSQRPFLSVTTLDAADLAITKSVNNPTPRVGEAITYTIVLQNLGPDAATNVKVTDLLPAGVRYDSHTPTQGTYTPATGVWSIGSVSVGFPVGIAINATVEASAGGSVITNVAAVSAVSEADPDPLNNTSEAPIKVPFNDFRMTTGTYVGTGAGPLAISGLGFQPDVILIRSTSNQFTVARTSTMAGDASKLLGSSTPLGAGRIVSLDGDGFTVGSAAEVNTFGINHYWVAFQAAEDRMAVGSYTGTDVDSRPINTVGFEPEYMILMAEINQHAMQRFATQPYDESFQLDNDGGHTDCIQDFLPLGFEVGKDDTANKIGARYHYVAWNSAADLIAQGQYLGNATDNRDLNGPGLEPRFVLVKNVDGGEESVMRTSDMVGDASFLIHKDGPQANHIQDLLSSGFQVGTDNRVNRDGKSIAWVAFRDQPVADLALTKVVDNPAPNENEFVVYTVTVTNAGPEAATGVQVTDLLPAGLSYVSHNATGGAYDDATGLWTPPSIVNGGDVTLDITARVAAGTQGTTITNTAAITAVTEADPDSGERTDSADITVQSADLSVSKSVDVAFPSEGDTLRYTIVIGNSGPHAATGIIVTDLLPAGVTYLADDPTQGSYNDGNGHWTVGALQVGEVDTLIVEATIDAGTSGLTILNTATITGADQADPDASDGAAIAGFTVAATDIVVAKTVDNTTPLEGGTIEYTIAVYNDGPDNATGVRIADALPAGVTWISDTPSQGSYDNGAGLWTLGAIAAGDSATLNISATVDVGAGGATISNVASVSALDQDDPNPGDNTTSVDITPQGADVVVTKVGPASVTENDTLVYTLTVRNDGPATAVNIAVSDSLPVSTVFVDASDGGLETGGVITWPTIASLAASDSVVYTVRASAPATGVLTNIARSGATSHDPVPGNNDGSQSVSTTTTVVAPADSFVISSVVSEHDYVTRGQILVGVDVTLSNQNAFDVRIVSGGLIFTNAIVDDRAGDYTVVPSPSNADTLLAGETATLRYAIEVATSAMLNAPIIVDASFHVEDLPGVWSSNPGGAIVPHVWRVITGQMRVLADLYDTRNTPVRADDALVGSIDLSGVPFDLPVALGSLGQVVQNDSTVYRVVLQFNPLLAQYNVDADTSSEGYWAIPGPSDGLNAEASDGSGRELLIPSGYVADQSTSPIDHVKAVTKEFTPAISWNPLAEIATSPVIDATQLGEYGRITASAPLGPFVDCVDGPSRWEGAGRITAGQFFVTELWFRPDMQWSAGDTIPLDFHLDGDGSNAPEVTGLGVEFLVVDDDTSGPDISSLTSAAALSTAGVTIVATIADISGVYDDGDGSAGQGVFLLWDTDGELTIDANEITMSRAAADTFVSDTPIPPQPAGASIMYQIFAFDDDADGGNSADRSQSAGSAGTIVVFDPVSLEVTPGTLYPTTAFPGQENVALRIGVDNTRPTGVTLSTGTSIGFSDSVQTYTAYLANPTFIPPGATNFTLSFAAETVPGGIGALRDYNPRLALGGTMDIGFAYAETLLTTGTNSIYVQSPRVWAETVVSGVFTARPGARDVAVLSMRLHNTYAGDRDLDSLTVTNTSTGVGSPLQIDTMVETLSLYDDADSSHTLTPSDALMATAQFTGGSATFNVSAWTLPAGASRSLIVTLDVDSVHARDGDILDVAVVDASDFVFVQPTYVDPSISPANPLNSFGQATIDGSMAFQSLVTVEATDTLFSGADNYLVATLVLPQNGYDTDVLTALELQDFSGGFVPADIDRVTLYEDDGDGAFDPLSDPALGTMAFSGDRYDISGLSVALDTSNVFFVAVDVSDNPTNGDRFLPGIPIDGITVQSGNDGPVDAAVVAIDTLVIIRVEEVDVVNLPLGAPTVGPGYAGVPVLSFSVRNNTLQMATLDSATVVNTTTGVGSQADMDLQMGTVRLYGDDGNGVVDPWDAELAQDTFVGGALVFDALGLALAPASIQHFVITCDVDSFCVRDGDSLRVALATGAALSFDTALPVSGDFPMVTAPARLVDGMAAFQVQAFESSDSLIITSPANNLVFDFAVPANGYDSDMLQSLTVTNLGTATDEHIARYYLYADGGDGAFDAGSVDDTYLGDFTPITPKVHRLTGMAVPLDEACGGGTRFFVACELNSEISSGASIQLSIPVLGIEVASSNDGPVDAAVVNPSIQFIPRPNELTVFPYSVGDKKVYPGRRNVLNFGVGFYNGFSTPVALESIRLFQQGSAISAEILEVRAYADADTNGLFNLDADTLVALTTSSDVYYDLFALELLLQPQRITYLFIAYDDSLHSRDSVTVNLQLNGRTDLTFDRSITVEGDFPINSPGVDTIDGMIAAQAPAVMAPEYRASPSEEDVFVLGLTVPTNGFLPDVLNFVTVANLGSAVAAQDITLLKLWVEDGGNPLQFDPSDDRLASALFWTGSGWRNPGAMNEFVAPGGLRCYITTSFAAGANDNRTVQAYIPMRGLAMASSNDGPLDQVLVNANMVTISTDPLITSLETDRSTYSVGQAISASMRVRNEGLIDLVGVHPSALVLSGAGGAALDAGPTPVTLVLPAGSDTTIVWTFTAAAAGDLRFCGSAFDADSSDASLQTCSPVIAVQNRAVNVSAEQADVSQPNVDRSQSNLQLIRFDIDYLSGDSLSAPVSLRGVDLVVRNGADEAIAPSSVLDALTLFSSTGSNFEFSLVDSLSNPVHLRFSEPIVIAPGRSVDLILHGDISAAAALGPFKLEVGSSGDIEVADANDNNVIPIATAATFPWQTKAINVTLPAETLLVSTPAATVRFANLGQAGVTLFELDLLNSGTAQSANEILSGMTLSFYDTTGAAISPGDVIRSLSIVSDGLTSYANETPTTIATHMACELTTDLLLPPQAGKRVDVVVDLRSFPGHGGFYIALDGPTAMTARDNNNDQLVDVVPVAPASGFPVRSASMVFQNPASGLDARFHSMVPSSVLPSTAGAPLLEVVFEHPDGAAANIAIDSLAFEFINGVGDPIFPGDYFTALTVVQNGDTLCSEVALSGVSSLVQCPLAPPIRLVPGGADSVIVFVDSRAVFSPVVFRTRVERQFVYALDTNSGERILSMGGAFPFVTAPGYLQIPGSDVACGIESAMPANVAGNETGLHAFDLLLRNDAPSGYTTAGLRMLAVAVEGWKGTRLDPADLFEAASLLVGDSVVATGTIAAGRIEFAVTPGAISIDPDKSLVVSVSVDLSGSISSESFRFVVTDTSSIQFIDESSAENIYPGTINNAGFPLTTRFTHVLGASLQAGFTNYPNPFAAGREETQITYFLDAPGPVTLKLYTLWGAPVATLLDGESRAAGLHQDVVWDGRNGDGETVNNGVYYLVLEVNGTSLKRKVGVIR